MEEKVQIPEQPKRRRWLLWAAILAGAAFLGILASGVTYAVRVTRAAPPLDLARLSQLSQITTVVDREGRPLGLLMTDGSREPISSLAEVSPDLVHGVIAVEDKDFYHHPGVDIQAIFRALWQNIRGQQIVSGASTLTQQTVKLVFFPDQARTLTRKIQEALLAIELERKLSKDEILTTYLNWAYFGQVGTMNVYGAEQAAHTFFGVNAKDLNLAEAAMLAALPNNPSLFSPYSHFSAAKERQSLVLSRMLEQHYINEEQYRQALAFDIQKALRPISQHSAAKYPYILDEVQDDAASLLVQRGLAPDLDKAKELLATGGFRIETTIDRDLQDRVNEAVSGQSYRPDIGYSALLNGRPTPIKNAMEQVGAAVVNNSDGSILAVYGGRDYNRDQIDHARLPRQPGSTMKPIGVYGPAVDRGLIGSGSGVDDVPTSWPGYRPNNFDNRFHGMMTVREALVQSYNIPALQVFSRLGPGVGMEYLKKLGITTLTPDDAVISAGIGGVSRGLTVEEATNAFTVFPNQGSVHPVHLITKIVDRDGRTVYQHANQTTQVFSPAASYILTDMLRDVVRRGTGSAVGRRFPSMAVAGKTGTTDDDRDSWFIGFTPDVTIGVWVGYNYPFPLHPVPGVSPRDERPRAVQVFADILQRARGGPWLHTASFPSAPSGVVRVSVCSKSGELPTALCRAAGTVVSELFVKGTEPKTACDVHVRAAYTVIDGKKYRATTATPPDEIRWGIFIQRKAHPPGPAPTDAGLEVPSTPDPRGGEVLPLGGGDTPQPTPSEGQSAPGTNSGNGNGQQEQNGGAPGHPPGTTPGAGNE
ncbi:glycosyl transferase [Kyrpidia spormannii]|uniref:Glycosyl transferase n=1 Tax=Kyrpidia spormannii TaxID=2055160 RepID=A0A2K8N828_9BACL|nr:transglycosylase domain-containing protein [Kyrpidia spormannii]ATY85491.1 glycosyl transferase [Kyrpidia spormannii]